MYMYSCIHTSPCRVERDSFQNGRLSESGGQGGVVGGGMEGPLFDLHPIHPSIRPGETVIANNPPDKCDNHWSIHARRTDGRTHLHPHGARGTELVESLSTRGYPDLLRSPGAVHQSLCGFLAKVKEDPECQKRSLKARSRTQRRGHHTLDKFKSLVFGARPGYVPFRDFCRSRVSINPRAAIETR